MVTGSVSFAFPNHSPISLENAYASHNANLFVSAENSLFSNTFAGASVIEIIVNDSDISSTNTVQPEPDVTVNGKKIRMVQAVDGNWYGYFADRSNALMADSLSGLDGTGLDFGKFCSSGTAGAILGVGFSDTVGVAIPRLSGILGSVDGTGHGTPSLSACTGVFSTSTPNINHVTREPPTLNTDPGAGGDGQIGIRPEAWPIIQLYDFVPAGNVVVTYNYTGGPQTTTLTFDNPFVDMQTDRTTYPQFSSVNLQITDTMLNIDPTDEDSWTFGASSTNSTTFYQLFDENGATDADGTAGAVDISSSISNLMFEDNGVFTLGGGNLANVLTIRDNDDQALPTDDPNALITLIGTDGGSVSAGSIPVTFTEQGANSGLFSNSDEADKSNILVRPTAPRGQSAIATYNNVGNAVLVGFDFGSIDLGSFGTWTSGEEVPVTLIDNDANKNTLADEDLDLFNPIVWSIPSVRTGTPFTLSSLSTANLTVAGSTPLFTSVDTFSDRALLTLNVPFFVSTPTSTIISLETTDTFDDLYQSINDPSGSFDGYNFFNYDVRSIDTSLVADSINQVTINLLDGTNTVQLVNGGPLQGFVNLADATGHDIFSMNGAQNVRLEFRFETPTFSGYNNGTTLPIVADFFSFGYVNDGELPSERIANQIVRLELEENGDNTGTFVGTLEPRIINQLNVLDLSTYSGLNTISDSPQFIVIEGLQGLNSPKIQYLDLGADGVSTEISDQQPVPAHSGNIAVDMTSYVPGDTVVVTLQDSDLNYDSDLIDIYTTVPSTPFDIASDSIGKAGLPNLSFGPLGQMVGVFINGTLWQNSTQTCGIPTSPNGLYESGFTLVESGAATGMFNGDFVLPSDFCQSGVLTSTSAQPLLLYYTDFRNAINEISSAFAQPFIRGPSTSIQSATGSGLIDISTNLGNFSSVSAEIISSPPIPAGLSFPHGHLSWNVTDISPGATITVTLTYPDPIPVGSEYWKLIGGSWIDVTSLIGSDDGDDTITLTITDGGLGDLDGIVNGEISDPGGIALVIATVPSAPTGLTALPHPSLDIINLSWTAPSSNGGSAITGYDIERESPIGGGFSVISTIGNSTTAGIVAIPGTQYNFRVSAINAIGVGAPSNEANATIPITNASPVALDDSVLTFVNSTKNNIDVLANDFDPDFDSLIVSSVISPTINNGAVIINATQTGINYIPDAGFEGFDSFNYTASDGNGGFANATVTVGVFGATVELDQAIYTWTDKMFITIVSPSANFDAGAIDVIGNDPATSHVNVTTSLGTLAFYGLNETGTDTGIFTGTIDLTGTCPHDADGDGNIFDAPCLTTGTGPTDGRLQTSIPSDSVSVSYLFGDNQFVSGSSLIRWNNGTANWLEASYAPDHDFAVFRIIDPDMNLDPNTVDAFNVTVNSLTDPVGFDVAVFETNDATGIFQQSVNFTSSGTSIDSGDSGVLRVTDGDPVFVYYNDHTLPPPFLTSENFTFIGQAQINSGNVAPIANDDTFTTQFETPVNNLNVLLNDVDADDDPLTILNVQSISDGFATINATNSGIDFVPDNNFVGSAFFNYTISDGILADNATVRVAVGPITDFLTKFGSFGSGNSQFSNIASMDVGDSGRLYVLDSGNATLKVFDSNFDFLFNTGTSGSGDGQFSNPFDVAVNGTEFIHVSDFTNNRVQVFDPSGNFLFKFGSSGSGDGQFSQPWGIGIDPVTGNILVTELQNDRVQVFDPSGNFLFKFGTLGNGTGQFDQPRDVAVDPSNRIHVVDGNNNRVQVFDPSGTFLFQYGSQCFFGSPSGCVDPDGSGPLELGDGQFDTPYGIDFDTFGNAYIIDESNNRIVIFDSLGNYLDKFGSTGSGDGQLFDPRGVNVIDNPPKIFVAGASQNRIQLFGLGSSPVAFDDFFTTQFETPLVNLDVLANDTDADFDSLLISQVGPTLNGGITVLNTSFTGIDYTPPDDFRGVDIFNYTITDGNGGFASANVTIPVIGANGKIVFSQAFNIFTINSDGTEKTLLVTGNATFPNRFPSWSPDGTKLILSSVVDKTPFVNDYDIVVINSDGTGITNISNLAGNDVQPSWSPNGEKIAFANDPSGPTPSQIFIINANGTNLINISNNTFADSDPQWSPDSTKILFVSTRDGNNEIYLMNVDGLNPIRLTNVTGSDSQPSWSPNGEKIAFTSNRDGNTKIYTMNADGSNPTLLTNLIPANPQPFWSPDGQKILFEYQGDLWTIHPDGSNLTRITFENSQILEPDWGTASNTVASVLIAFNDSYKTQTDTPLIVPAPGVLANDTSILPLSAVLVLSSSTGVLNLNSDGSFDYTPPVGFEGKVSFLYNATNGVDMSNTANATINVIKPSISFTKNPAQYVNGENVFVTVNDPVANNSTLKDVISANLTRSSGGVDTTILVSLTETGINTSKFTNTTPVILGTTIPVNAGDTLTATYLGQNSISKVTLLGGGVTPTNTNPISLIPNIIQIEDGGEIRIFDSSKAGNGIQIITAFVSTVNDPTGILVSLTETANDSGEFVSDSIIFSNQFTKRFTNIQSVDIGNNVFISYPISDTKFFLRSNTGALPQGEFQWGYESSRHLVGNWDGDNDDDIGTFNSDGRWWLRDNDIANTYDTFLWGNVNSRPLVGNWDGDNDDDIGTFNSDGRWHLRDLDTGTYYAPQFLWGNVNSIPVVGDWDGDGRDDIGTFNSDGRWHLRDLDTGTYYAPQFLWGNANSIPVVGDWDGDGRDDIGTFNSDGRWHLRDLDTGTYYTPQFL
ncbi:MAG: cadherin-like domain-containing protein, partial [Nitrosopumilus sp.]|uniref:Ig-like domain-containing protein n=1 Tax=Nitrosopumilus sp. TaxID=2024843 RepID=UPI00247BB5E8